MSQPNSAEKKLFIDEDWKAQVQAEKEAFAQRQAAEMPAAAAPTPSEQPAPVDEPPPGPLPPPTLTSLCTLLATQAMMSMEAAADPATPQRAAHLAQAKYFVDLLAMLEDKTQGNRSPDEISLLSNALHELRMVFVQASVGVK